ncbi:MAG: efflux RND transporter permease subunit [Rickettsiales bacterium]
MARFFIDRPVFAWVIAIIIMLAGVLSIKELPVEQYPKVAPPTIIVNARYPGASAETVENSVTQIIEQSLSGLDHLRYFSSVSADGAGTVTLTFEPEADPDVAQVQTQNKVQAAIPQLPQEVQQLGVTVTKSNANFLLVVGLYSESDKYTRDDLADMLVSNFRDPLSRINGVGDTKIFGEQHAMRLWLDPAKLYAYNLTPIDVENAVRAQNTDISAGQLGGMPAVPGQQINATIKALARLESEKDFENIILRVQKDGSQIRVKDVAKVGLGSESYAQIGRYKRMPATGIAISLSSGANALETAKAVKDKVKDLAKLLPEGVKVVYPYDTTPFVQLSIESVVHTLIEAVVLVFFVMLLFLQNIRATLIPTIAVPVVLLGTFAILNAFGFTINTLTMFGMVLAIGLLVDDAIVVVENVERIMAEENLSPKEATRKSMDQITSALVGIATVLSTVFIPMAFFSGSAGAIYRQFSLTIVSAMCLSVLVALILSPSLCATFLKQSHGHKHQDNKGFFGRFNHGFDKLRDAYRNSSLYIARRGVRFFVIYALLIGGLVYGFTRLPGAFLPNEDQGIMFMMVSSPPGATAERTLESVKKVEDYFLSQKEVEHLFTVVGFSFAGSAQNAALGFVALKDWSERGEKGQDVFTVANKAMGAFMQIKDAMAFTFVPPPIRELGNASGFDMQIVDRKGIGHDALMNARNQLLGMAAQNPKLIGVRPNGLNDVPQYRIRIDAEKASAMGVSLADVNKTLQIAWGSGYVNDFIDKGRIKRVYMQGIDESRMMPDDVNKWYVRNNRGEMVAFADFSTGEWTYGSPKLERFNGASSVNIQGSPAPGVSTGEAMEEMQEMASKLPIDVEWYGISYEERAAGSKAPALYGLSILVVFLCLAALYESWAVPFAVMLAVPIGVLGAVVAGNIFGLSNDVYFQVALLTTVGLAAKNAILIVEFAKELKERQGLPTMEAVGTAAKQRFRPIVMTSMAFMLGVSPLAFANGAGAAGQNAIGFAVLGGMTAATLLAILFVPLFFTSVDRLTRAKERS